MTYYILLKEDHIFFLNATFVAEPIQELTGLPMKKYVKCIPVLDSIDLQCIMIHINKHKTMSLHPY